MDNTATVKNVHAGHRERMKDRYLESGADGFATHELLEMLLYYGIPQKDTNAMAHEMIERFGSLEGVLSASANELMSIPGIKKHATVLISLVAEIKRRCDIENTSNRRILDTQTKIEAYIKPLFSMLGVEKFYALFLDNSLRLIKCVCISEGTVNSSNANVRKIVEEAIFYNATNVILAHNHPNGIAVPSGEDKATTKNISEVLRCINVNVLEHFIVANDRCSPILHIF